MQTEEYGRELPHRQLQCIDQDTRRSARYLAWQQASIADVRIAAFSIARCAGKQKSRSSKSRRAMFDVGYFPPNTPPVD
jgi:hypothetical protein